MVLIYQIKHGLLLKLVRYVPYHDGSAVLFISQDPIDVNIVPESMLDKA